MLRHLGMRADGPPPVAQPIWIRAQRGAAQPRTPASSTPRSNEGIPSRRARSIGRITDFHGKVVEEIRAPFAGEILYVIGTPPISKGEPVAMVGAIGAAPQ